MYNNKENMTNYFKLAGIICLVLSSILFGICFFANIEFFDSVDSIGVGIVTFILLILFTIICVVLFLKFMNDDESDLRYASFVVGALFLFVPIRGFVRAASFDPLKNFKVTLKDVNCYVGPSNYHIDFTIEYQTDEKVKINTIEGSLLLYEDSTVIDEYLISCSTPFNMTPETTRTIKYEINSDDADICRIADDDVQLYYQLNKIGFNSAKMYSHNIEKVRLR